MKMPGTGEVPYVFSNKCNASLSYVPTATNALA